MNKKFIYGAIMLTFIVAVLALLVGLGAGVQSNDSTGGITNLDGLTITPAESGDGLKVGSNGSTLAEMKVVSCDLIGSNGSHAASTTKPYDCAITGITSSDVAFAQLATSTAIGSGSLGWAIVASKASTTAGYVTVLLANFTGAAAVPSATSVGSSTSVVYFDN